LVTLLNVKLDKLRINECIFPCQETLIALLELPVMPVNTDE